MTAYVPIRCDLADDPRVRRAAAALKVHPDRVVGAVARFWGVCYQTGKRRGKDIIAPHYTVELFEADCDQPGMVEALKTVGWADVHEDGSLIMPRGTKYIPQTHKERRKEWAERKRVLRDRVSRSCPENVSRDNREILRCSSRSSSSRAASSTQSKSRAAAEAAEAGGQEQTPPAAPVDAAAPILPAGADAALLPDAQGRADRTVALRLMGEMGIDPQARHRLIGRPGLTAALVFEVRERWRVAKNVKNRAGWARAAIEARLAEAGRQSPPLNPPTAPGVTP